MRLEEFVRFYNAFEDAVEKQSDWESSLQKLNVMIDSEPFNALMEAYIELIKWSFGLPQEASDEASDLMYDAVFGRTDADLHKLYNSLIALKGV